MTLDNTSEKFVDLLNGHSKYAFLFGGQGSPWRQTLNELATGSNSEFLHSLVDEVLSRLQEIQDQIIVVRPEFMKSDQFFGESKRKSNGAREVAKFDSDAVMSIPGILLAQIAALKTFKDLGVDFAQNPPAYVDGHSQGILAKEAVKAMQNEDHERLVQILAISQILGLVATKVTENLRIYPNEKATPMLSVKGATASIIQAVIAKGEDTKSFTSKVAIAVKNDENHFICSGYPSDLQALVELLEKASAVSKRRLEEKVVGGTPLEIQTEFLAVSVPFHSELLSSAVEIVVEWASKCGLDSELSRSFAQDILVNQVDWSASVSNAVESGAKYMIDFGPTAVIGKMTAKLLQGTGCGIADASSLSALTNLSKPGFRPQVSASWDVFAPNLLSLPNGKQVVSTAFTRLTGKSPVMLAGMTPTTVEPDIVAAAANAGFWAEMAGGGQVTADVFNENLAGLQSQLKPGQTAQFNSMFLDRYLWNLQFGGTKIVSRARAAGAPIDGVIITAGIPEFDEAVELVQTLNKEGFPFVAFKPGTVAQINQVIAIAKAVPDFTVIMQVEDGHAGGHHSWENLDDLLLATYSTVREVKNIVLCAGGGIGTPQAAADYVSGDWSLKYLRPKMPVDAVMVGTVAMTAKEAKTTPEVKKLLLETKGIELSQNQDETWVGSGKSRGGMTSGLSHLRADIYEIDNDSAACARLIAEVGADIDLIAKNRDQIIEAMNKTAKPYFGDVDKMTYFELASRFANLCFLPGQNSESNVEESWIDRFFDILRRAEARLVEKDNGEFVSHFASVNDVKDFERALNVLKENYPSCLTQTVVAQDTSWFIECCRKHPKPVPFVPRIDNELLKWWGSDSLWQSHDGRYPASACRIIPGPISVAGIDRIDEPISQLLSRFEGAIVERLNDGSFELEKSVSRLGTKCGTKSKCKKITDREVVKNSEELIKASKHISWTGHLINNPANFLKDDQFELKPVSGLKDNYDLLIKFDTFWDEFSDPNKFHVVHSLTIPLKVTPDSFEGACPVVDEERLPENMYAMLAATAGVGSTMTSGDYVDQMPQMQRVESNIIGGVEFSKPNFGRAKFEFTVSDNLGPDHASVTGGALSDTFVRSSLVPDALLGTCWPPIYAALGSAMKNDYPVIEGLLNAVHLDHTIDLVLPLDELKGKKLTAYAWSEDLEESVSGRIVDIRLAVTISGSGSSPEDEQLALTFRERFAVQGRASGTNIPAAPNEAGGKMQIGEILPTKRRVLRIAKVKAPSDMTPFARVSGDYNPIHTSTNAAQVAGLVGPIVHGMWLSATAQHLISATVLNENNKTPGFKISGWTVQWYAPTNLNDEVEITVERTGKIAGGGLILEAIAKINGNLTAKFTAATEPIRAAYCYPGQGIQHQGMGLDEIASSKAADSVWKRADRHTRNVLGFSILSIVKENPTELVANGVRYFHPDGLLNLTQFTQVSLAVVGFAQTARLRESGSAVDGAFFAGHSLGEYVALSSYGNVIPLETVIELVFARGSAMHSLVPRDDEGRSNYLMGALRPNQFGLRDSEVKGYVESVSQATGEFLEIVNYNLAGQQYAVAGTIAGLKALAADAQKRVEEYGGKGAFMYVPGIDVPFHSSVLRTGVPEFREKLMKLLPQEIDYDSLVNRYIPNLVARPFEFTFDFAKSILSVVPSETIEEITASDQAWADAMRDKDRLGRILLVELLCWQFASPVRWIETQALLFNDKYNGGLGIDQFVEVGLKNAPTLANLASKTLQLPEFSASNVSVFNIQRDEARVFYNDDDAAMIAPEIDDEVAETPAQSSSDASAETSTAQSAPSETAQVANNATPAPAPVATSGVAADDVPFNASDAIAALFALSNKLLPEQIGPNDNAETLTNGVSSRRNQLLMDMSAELGLASIDSAAEAPVSALYSTVDKMAHNYKPFGPVLSDAIRAHIRKLFGSAGAKQTRIQERVQNSWGLGDGWVNFVTIEILLGTREGASMRGGDLANLGSTTPSNAAAVDALIDSAVTAIAARRGVAVSLAGSGGGGGGATVSSEALDAFAETVTGENGILAQTARNVLEQLGIKADPVDSENQEFDDAKAVVEAVEIELGSDWFKRVSPSFDAQKAVLLDDRFAWAKEDLARLFVTGSFAHSRHHQEKEGEFNFIGAGIAISQMASYYANRCRNEQKNELAKRFEEIAQDAATTPDENNLPYLNDTAVITGATPTSISGAVAAKLLEGGAKVIITASRVDAGRLDYAKDLYHRHAAPGAELWLVPANLSSYRDVDALVDWIGSDLKETVGGKTKIVKPKMTPTLLFPFAAPRVMGTMADAGSEAEMETRLLLWSVERMIANLSQIGVDTDIEHKLHVVLPGSPNRGIFGGDGAYGEVKAAFDAIEKRWNVEKRWAKNVTIAHPKIGWVRGTSLMGGNDPLVGAIERTGVHTYSTEEMANELLSLCSNQSREAAKTSPLDVDLTGGLGGMAIDLKALQRQAMAEIQAEEEAKAANKSAETKPTTIKALPSPVKTTLPKFNANAWQNVSAKPEEMAVIVGIGEVGPWGSGRTRFEAEHGIQTDGTVKMTASGVLELAWMMDLIHWSDTPKAGWYDESDTLVPEEEIYDRFRDEVVARSGVRAYVDDSPAWIKDLATEQDVAVFLDRDISFSVPDKATALAFSDIDPERTVISENTESGEWTVTKLAGAKARVPRKTAMTRRAGGQLPTNFNPAKWGIPQSMIESVDRLAIWNLVSTVDAFLSSGFTPAELLQAVHPSDVGSTQGTGIGGTDSMRKLFVDGFLGEDRPSDILQEALPNVIAAHVMQSFVGGYGVMVHPVGACATAAVSIEDAVDKLNNKKADFIVAGAIDDISIESITGFGDMNATAKTQDLLDKGINERFVSRANDRRRGGFVESEGGGTVLITRGDIALKLGLPVFGVVGYSRSFADGAHTSIPAPGLGALGAVRGGKDSVFVRDLAALGVKPDDIAVVSKHDTSTNANDPNESELYTRISRAIGRETGNPLFVISQKTVTGHAKGGAAVFQVAGLCQLFNSGRIPANRALDCVGPEFATHDPITWLREPLDLGLAQEIKAGLVTSLGFGHVSALIAVVNPGAFEASVLNHAGEEAVQNWRNKANERLAAGRAHFEDAQIGKRPLFEQIDHRRFAEQSRGYDPHEVEAGLLLSPDSHLSQSGKYEIF